MSKQFNKILDRVCEFFATGFYIGRIPWAPGTAGSALALLLYWINPLLRGAFLGIVVVVFFLSGAAAATRVEKRRGHDASCITIDEITGFWLVLLLMQSLTGIWHLIAFFVFRFMDIVKPFPADTSQRLPAGWGIMADDMIAALYTVFWVHFLFAIY